MGTHLIVNTDNNPLTYVLTTAKLDACGQRWVSAIAPMNFNLHYKPGRTNIDADALSRLPCSEEIPNEEVQAMLKGCLEQPQFLWEAYACSAKVTEGLKDHLQPSRMGPKEWKAAQLKDPTISTIYKMLANKTLSHRIPNSRDDMEVKSYLHQKI